MTRLKESRNFFPVPCAKDNVLPCTVPYLKRRLPENEPSISPSRGFALLVYRVTIVFGSAQKPEKVKKKTNCESTHNVLLRGAEKVIPLREDNKDYSSLREAMRKNMSTHAFFSDAITEESAKGLLPIASLAVS